jgi:glycosyltransferase involved in cell wall biosynthesis
MQNKLNVSVILPIKTSKAKDFDQYFEKCIISILNQTYQVSELIIVHTDEEGLVDKIKNTDFSGISVNNIVWTKEPSFGAQVNEGIKSAKSEWVSVLEFDDEYSSIWFKNVNEYVNSYPDADGFLPIVIDVDERGNFIGFTNEATFAANFSQEIGILTNDLLHDYQNFQTSGAVFRKEKVEEFGLFKDNMKLTFPYEFLLRMTYHSMKLMTIPKLGYKHMNLREGSIFWNYKLGTERLDENEIKFWIESAKKEYFFTKQRDIKYEPQSI